jgi:tetratricopeptide (TPR) repeat protein
MALSEIEKLERRYTENPQGLTFAPLAEVHRKNGDVARALELLRSGLTLHPDYIPASIVLGRCHLDLGDLPSAETAFTHVLSLDGENVIALKALADIAERQYRFDESERWLHALLAVDRSNDEAREQLSRVEASRRQAQVASSASPDAAALVGDEAPGASAEVAASEMDAGIQASSEETTSPADTSAEPETTSDPMLAWAEGSGSTAAAEATPLELEELDLTAADEAERPAGLELDQGVSLEEPVEPLSGLVGRHDHDPGPDLHVSSDGWAVETAEDIVLESAGASEFQVANAAEELLSKPSGAATRESVTRDEADRKTRPADSTAEGASAEPIEPAAEGASAEPIEPAAASTPMAEAAAEPPAGSTDAAAVESTAGETDGGPTVTEPSWSPPVAEPPRQSEADLLVTESMAELLLEQGHSAEALTVYRHLEGRTGGERFRAKIAELENRAAAPAPAPAASESAPAPSQAAPSPSEPAAAPERPREPNPAYSVQQTHGRSVQTFLRGVLGARPPVAAPAPPPAGPERGVADAAATGAPTRPAHDSLSLSSVFGEESTPAPPAVPAGGAGAAPGGVSYDEFFGTANSAPARPSRTPDAKSDDLDQFHAWLQNLKR